MKLKQWKEDDRPREKLILKGKAALSDAELLAIVLGSGSANESAFALGQRILAHHDQSLTSLSKQPLSALTQFKGVGPAKGVSMIAALELARRVQQEHRPEREKISGSSSAYEYLHPHLGSLAHEEFWILYLNNANKVLHCGRLSQGGITSTTVDVRLVFHLALQHHAVSLILAHNHPSGQLQPSQADKQLTRKIVTAGKSLDIQVLDHLIVTEKAYFSFADQQLL